jgi:hypothetical protein
MMVSGNAKQLWVARPELPAMGVVIPIPPTTPFAWAQGRATPNSRIASNR